MHLFDEQDEVLPEIKNIYEKTGDGMKAARKTLEKAALEIEKVKAEFIRVIKESKWYQSMRTSTAAYKQLADEYVRKGSPLNLSLYGEWAQQHRQLQQQLQSLESIKKENAEINNQINECCSQFACLRDELLKRRHEFIDSVIGSNPFVHMELAAFGDVSTLETDYRELLNMEGDRFASSILDNQNKQGLIWELSAWRKNNIPEQNLPNLLCCVKRNTIALAKGQSTDLGNIDNRFKTRLQDIWKNRPSVFDHLLAWFPEDLLCVKYSRGINSGKFDDIGDGSPGQKAAAILAFLLSYGDQPLLIDQPEDDLDNALIYDLIVSQIHLNKNRRQHMIATHNPNIVVNGDAELVVSLKFGGGQARLDISGSLEDQKVRDSVCDIMEGGREAFEKRYKRLTLEV
jgi:hypothetical protein